jgi:hypothetical protein
LIKLLDLNFQRCCFEIVFTLKSFCFASLQPKLKAHQTKKSIKELSTPIADGKHFQIDFSTDRCLFRLFAVSHTLMLRLSFFCLEGKTKEENLQRLVLNEKSSRKVNFLRSQVEINRKGIELML